MTINTVLGPIERDALGHTLTHEHVISSSAGLRDSFPEIVDRKATIAAAVADLRTARRDGLTTIVDMAPFDLGRDVRALATVSRRSGVNIVAASGVWRAPPREFLGAGIDALAAIFAREVEVGIDGTPIRAGVLKIATDERGMTPENDHLARAVARAHLATGVPIATHAHAASRAGWSQLDVLEDEGVDPSRVCVGHSDDTSDPAYARHLLQRGAWLGFDHMAFTPPQTPSAAERISLLAELLGEGLGSRILIGHDFNPTVYAVTQDRPDARSMNPDAYAFYHRRVKPQLLEHAVDAARIDALTLENPARFLPPSLAC